MILIKMYREPSYKDTRNESNMAELVKGKLFFALNINQLSIKVGIIETHSEQHWCNICKQSAGFVLRILWML